MLHGCLFITLVTVFFFFCRQCEVKQAQKRGRLESSAGEDEEGDDGVDSDSDDESSAKARYFSYVKQGLYYVTEMERFAPPRKRPRTVMKNYRLVSLRSTTPEELYQRKVGTDGLARAVYGQQVLSANKQATKLLRASRTWPASHHCDRLPN